MGNRPDSEPTDKPASSKIRILKKAGIKPWPKFFQNLRSSRESELIKEHGIERACEWIGTTPAVAMKHYLQIAEGDFGKATGNGVGRQAG